MRPELLKPDFSGALAVRALGPYGHTRPRQEGSRSMMTGVFALLPHPFARRSRATSAACPVSLPSTPPTPT